MATLLAQVKAERDPVHQTAIAGDGFAALEEKIRRTVEMLLQEREARHAAEQEVARLSESTMGDRKRVADMERELEGLRRERGEVKVRVERLLAQMDELAQG
jgi:chromosome segregation ATPase